MTDDPRGQIASLVRENKLLSKKLARSEANRIQAEKMKDETDALYENVLRQVAEQKRTIERAQAQLKDAFGVISSSIDYAARIQRSVLSDATVLDSSLEDHFVLWEPRDQVGGDIYWCEVWGDGLLIILGDCTGHGVPGAFMTLISSGALERAKMDVDEGDLAALVGRMHQLVQITLRQNTSGSESDDGMELGACYLSADLSEMRFVGARSELFIVRDGDVREIKGTRKGMGYRAIDLTQEYEVHHLSVDDRASYYLATDGFTDQIGGPKRLMFGKKRFKELLVALAGLPMADQRERLMAALRDYQGAEIRRDDVSVLGFRVRKSQINLRLDGIIQPEKS